MSIPSVPGFGDVAGTLESGLGFAQAGSNLPPTSVAVSPRNGQGVTAVAVGLGRRPLVPEPGAWLPMAAGIGLLLGLKLSAASAR